jgi:RNA polymerase sigma-70 factor, ECF subfamily
MRLSDPELIIKFNNGNTAAFEELVYRYDRQVLSLALKYLKDEDEAKDVYQEVFIRVYKGLKKFQFKSEFSTWLFRVTTNVCLTYKTRTAKREYVSIDEERDEEDSIRGYTLQSDVNETSPDSILSGNEIRQQVNEAVDLLPPKQKMCFMLKHYEGYKIREIAEIMNCKEGTVKKYLFDSIKKLREHLNSVYKI